MKFIDLFAGIGGFHLAMASLGHECVFAADIDPHARAAYEANFGLRPAGDITQVDAADIPAHDLVCAGFPCQSFSGAVFGAGDGIDDPRGRLFYEMIRIMKHHRPQYALLENVRAILTANQGEAIKIIEAEFEQIGYSMQYRIMKAEDFGVAQARRRVIFLLARDGNGRFGEPVRSAPPVPLGAVMREEPETPVLDKSRVQWIKPEPDLFPARKCIRIGTIDNRVFQGYRVYHHGGLAVTQLADGGGPGHHTGLYLDPQGRVRRLDLTEAKRVMGFPDKHEVGRGVQGYKRLGNAVVPPMIEAAAMAAGLFA